MADPFTIRVDEVYVETFERLEEEGYIDSRTEGFIYAIDRTLEANNPDYVPVTQPDAAIDQKASEIFQEVVEEEKYPFNPYEFKQDSLEVAREAARMAEELGDEEAKALAEQYVERYFSDVELEDF